MLRYVMISYGYGDKILTQLTSAQYNMLKWLDDRELLNIDWWEEIDLASAEMIDERGAENGHPQK